MVLVHGKEPKSNFFIHTGVASPEQRHKGEILINDGVRVVARFKHGCSFEALGLLFAIVKLPESLDVFEDWVFRTLTIFAELFFDVGVIRSGQHVLEFRVL